jgi:hypothetical protein
MAAINTSELKYRCTRMSSFLRDRASRSRPSLLRQGTWNWLVDRRGARSLLTLRLYLTSLTLQPGSRRCLCTKGHSGCFPGLSDFLPDPRHPRFSPWKVLAFRSPDVPILRFLQPSACPGHPGSLRRHRCFSLSKSFPVARLSGFSFTQLPNYPFTKSTKIYLLVNTLTPPLPPPHSSQSIPVWRRFHPSRHRGYHPYASCLRHLAWFY